MLFTRRQVITRGFLGTIAAAAAYGVFRTKDTTDAFELVESNVAISNLPPAFNGYRIGFITDTHLGMYVPTEWVDQAMSMLKTAGVDLLLLGGDFIWLPDKDFTERIYPLRNPHFRRRHVEEPGVAAEIFATIADLALQVKAKDGIFAVLGNHDRWTNPFACRTEFKKRGIRTLVNEHVEIERLGQKLRLIGVDDYWTGIPSFPKLPERMRGTEARILLSHNPDFVSELLRTGLPDIDLNLSGHTHGGQVKLPFLGALHANIEDGRFREGFYRDNRLTSYTSRGVGVVEIPIRFNCPPEITLLTLTAV